jgi:hypothetical protein
VTTFLASLNLLLSDSPAANFQTGERTFPAFYSTLAPAALADLVFSRYEIDVPKNCQFWHRGLSDVYLPTFCACLTAIGAAKWKSTSS